MILKKRNAIAQMDALMVADATTSLIDLISGTSFTMTGGLCGSFAAAGNFETLLGSSAPIISAGGTNILSAQNSSLEGAGTGNWAIVGGAIANSTTWAYVGTHSLKCTGGAGWGAYIDITAVTSAGSQYTLSTAIKAATLGGFAQLSDDVGANAGNLIAASATDISKTTRTFAPASTWRQLWVGQAPAGGNPYEFYADGLKLETGATQTPFPCTMTIPTATIGLSAGQSLSLMFATKTTWAGDDGSNHYLFSNVDADGNGIEVLKTTGSDLLFRTYNAWDSRNQYGGVASAWTANTAHIVIATITGTTMRLFLDGVELTSSSGTGAREPSLNANCYFGTDAAGAYHLEGSILPAMWGRALA